MAEDLLYYSLMQTELQELDPEALKRAFQSVPQLVGLDAMKVGRDSFGILAQHLPKDDAIELQKALGIEGIFTEIVATHELLELPPPRPLPKVVCTLTALIVYDSLGREAWIDWPKVVVLAAGSVPVPVTDRTEAGGPGGVGMMRMTGGGGSSERIEKKLILDVVLNVSPGRYRIEATKFNYEYLNPPPGSGAVHNFKSLVVDIIGHADNAALNGGAAMLREDLTTVFEYPSKQAFEQEIVWLLWKMSAPQ